jgi:site-specific DNA-methyltransferase (adenine-specific)
VCPYVSGTFTERAGWQSGWIPEQVLGQIIRTCPNAGSIILDPFRASGITLTVSKKLSRQFLGFELSADYAAAI